MKIQKPELTSAGLHILAMFFMLLDHMWATVATGAEWMTCLGRIAFPIFAFMIVEGYFHTHNLKKYMGRMFLFALISEVPFDILTEGLLFYPFHQNVLWTFLIGLLGIHFMERAKASGKRWKWILVSVLTVLGGFLAGMIGMTDFYGAGVLTVFVFYFFRGRNWWCYLGQFAVLYWLNMEVLGGKYYPVTLFGRNFELMQQGFALLALIPIWLYRGRKGYSSRWFQYFCYGFYPLHCLILGLIALT